MLEKTPSTRFKAEVWAQQRDSTLAFIRYSKNDGIVVAVIGVLVGAYFFYRGFSLLQRKRLILNTPASKIRSASMGLVEVNGLAAGPYILTAPLTGAACYYFRSMAWQWQKSGKNSEWVKVADESLHLPFFLDDNTGRVLVNPQGAEMDIHRDFHDEYSTSFFSSSLEVPANVFAFLGRHGVSTDKKIKIDEYCIKPKNALFILGTLAENPGLSVSPRPIPTLTAEQQTVSFAIPGTRVGVSLSSGVTGAQNMLFAASGGEPGFQENVYVSLRNPAQGCDETQQEKISAALVKAGITNPAAWAAAGVSPYAVATPASAPGAKRPVAAATAPEQFDLHPPIVLMKGEHDPAFFISWHSQRDVVRSLSWKSALMIWGGPTLTLLCFYIVAVHFDWL